VGRFRRLQQTDPAAAEEVRAGRRKLGSAPADAATSTHRPRHTSHVRKRSSSPGSAFGLGPEEFTNDAKRFARWFRADDPFGEEPQMPPDLLDTLTEIDRGLTRLLAKVS
jgi:hypothetical protein